MKHGEK